MTADINPMLTPWQHALRAGALLAIARCGALLRAQPGPVRDRWLAETRAYLPAGTPWQRLAPHTPLDRLLGGLDLAATLAAGRPLVARGVLSACDGGVVLLSMAERADAGTVSALCAALDEGELCVERDGISAREPARIDVIACDERAGDDPGTSAALAERLALHLDLDAVGHRDLTRPLLDAETVAAARERFDAVEIADDEVRGLIAAAHSIGVDSLRVIGLALRVARAAAALDGASCIDRYHAALAAQLVLAPRARVQPAASEPPSEGPPPEAPPPGADDSGSTRRREDINDLIVAATHAVIPDHLLQSLAAGPGRARRGGGRVGARSANTGRGRPLPARPGTPGAGKRLDLVATLRAAAPWQKLRGARPLADGGRVALRNGDLHVQRREQRSRTLTVFVVDASGSTAARRLAEVKAAVELMLADCYVRRDQVALVAFRGARAELVLAPTRALARARRCLADLPGGGGSPLAAGLALADDVIGTALRDDTTPLMVLLSDGRPNVDLAGIGGADNAARDALATARRLATRGIASLLIDVAPRPRPFSTELAAALGARYLALPDAQATSIAHAARVVADAAA